MAHVTGLGLHLPHPQARGGEAIGHTPVDGPVHGLQTWAGTRLCEVMRWEESWVHPRAYRFRVARGAVDAATVT